MLVFKSTEVYIKWYLVYILYIQAMEKQCAETCKVERQYQTKHFEDRNLESQKIIYETTCININKYLEMKYCTSKIARSWYKFCIKIKIVYYTNQSES